MCVRHTSHTNNISEGSGGRKASTAKQPVAALAAKLIKNTTVWLHFVHQPSRPFQGLLAFMPLNTLPLVALHSRSQH